MISTMTRSRRPATTIQNVLYAKVDIMSLPLACNLNSIHEAGYGSMRPAARERERESGS